VIRFFTQYRRIILFIIAVIVIFWLLWISRNILLPFIIGLILAYLLLPPIYWIEAKLPRRDRWKQTKRISLIVLIYLIVLAIIAIILVYTVPVIADSISQFISDLPQLIPQVTRTIQNFINSILRQIPTSWQDQVNAYISSLPGMIGGALQSGLGASLTYISGTFSLVLGFASLPVFLFYLLKDAERLSQGFYSSLSPWTAEQAKNIIGIIRDVLGRYIRSSIVLGLVVGILDFIGLFVLGIPFAPALAFWAAVTELIPVLGPWLGAAAGVIVTLATDPSKTIWVIILYFAVQTLEGNLLVPRIHGQYLQVHPAIILALLVIGAHLGGLWGIILIVPVTSVLIRIFKYVTQVTKREQTQGPGA
jgi:predicted PurR-regulated permease PerM